MSSEFERAADRALPVPTEVTEAARAAFDHRAAGSLATLVDDAVEAAGSGGRRRLKWTTETCEIAADISPVADRWTVVGHIDGAALVAASVEVPGSTTECESTGDDFRAGDVPSGPMRLLLDIRDGARTCRVHTDWVTV